MAFSFTNFQPLSFEQNNPALTGVKAGQDIFKQGVENAYLPSTLAQQLQQLKYNNQILAPQAQYAPQITLAKLAESQAQAPYIRALTGAIPSEIDLREAQAGFYGSDAEKNRFLIRNPQYINPDAYIYGSPAARADLGYGGQNDPNVNTNQSSTHGVGNNTINGSQQDVDQMNQMHPGDTYSLKGDGSVGNSPPPSNTASSLIMRKLHPLEYKAKEHQQASNIDINNKLISEAAGKASGAIDVDNTIKRMRAIYPQLAWYEKGPGLGGVHAITNAAQEFDQGGAALQQHLLSAWQQGRITDKDIGFVNKLGIGRHLNQDAFNTITDFTQSLQKRIAEEPKFYAAAAKAGIPPSISQALWTAYKQERPVYDYDKQKPLNGNINSWKDYLSPEAQNAIIDQGGEFSPRTHIDGKERVTAPNGDIYAIPQKSVMQFLMDHKDHERVR